MRVHFTSTMIHQLTHTTTNANGYHSGLCSVCCQQFCWKGAIPQVDGCTGERYVPPALQPDPTGPAQIANRTQPDQTGPSPDGSAWLANGGPVATQAEQKRRLLICNKCDRLAECLPTPCAMRKAWETGDCPEGRWDARRRNIPATGLISPADQWCIQIEITNACPRHCSNCTRHCPHVAEPFWMDAETFDKAVRSMDGYPGMLGIQGGEPTLHPLFKKLVALYDRLWEPERKEFDWGRRPIEDFGAYCADMLANVNHRRGLWSGLGPGYYRHFEAIQDTFPYQCINDHRNPAKHAPLLVTRKELGIPDAEWVKYRDACWVQRQWSSSITPRGCFPCEIMASLDMLYDGPGGWPIEPDWWKRQPADFGAMLDWCEQCGACLPLPEREAREGIHDVSMHHLEMLWRVGSPAVKAGKYAVFDVAAWQPAEVRQDADRYMPPEWRRKRVAQSNRSIKPRRIEAVVVSVGCADQLACVLASNAPQFDRIAVVTSTHDEKTQAVALAADGPIELVLSDDCYKSGDAFNKGRMLNRGLEALRLTDWVLNIDADILLPADFGERIRGLVLNPGCLYYTRRRAMAADGSLGKTGGAPDDFFPHGYFQLWNVQARALATLSPIRYPDLFVSAGNVDTWWQLLWPWPKKIRLPVDDSDLSWDVGHVPHGPLTARWNGDAPNGGWRYVGQNNIQPGTPRVDRSQGGWLRIVRVDDCFTGIVPVESIRPGVPHKARIYEYQWRAALTADEPRTTWDAFFTIAAREPTP